MYDNEEEQKDTGLSTKKIAFMLAGVVFIIMIVVISIMSCSKKDEVQNQSELVSQVDDNYVQNKEKTQEGVEERDEVKDAEDPMGNDDVENVSNVDGNKDKNNAVIEVENIPVGNISDCESLISDKKYFIINDSTYVYALSLLMPIGKDGEYSVIDYFCSKATFDDVHEGESLKVQYSKDGSGRVAIMGISK